MKDPIFGLTPAPGGPVFPPLPDPVPWPEPVPLPDPIPNPRGPISIPKVPRIPGIDVIPRVIPRFKFKSIDCGCYLLNLNLNNSYVTYDGTMRVECNDLNRMASGDLYQRPFSFLPFPYRPFSSLPPNPANGIPILARKNYRYYLRVTKILQFFTFSDRFTLGFEMHRYTKALGGFNTGGRWTNTGYFEAEMVWRNAPQGYPTGADYLEGDVRDSTGQIVGRLKMGWISKHLRKATVEIDRVAASEAPLNNGADVNWKTVGDSIGWNITVDESDNNIVEPSGEAWSNAEVHAALLRNRDANNLDTEWRYHILAVRRLEATSRGIMYDNGGTDSNNIPREGCAIASHWMIPNQRQWGDVSGQRFGEAAAPYYRTAVHELGHAMGIYHNSADNGFMNTTGVIASRALASGTPNFPNNIQWSFNEADAKRLKHFPDIYVRPGATPWGTSYSSTPISDDDWSFEIEDLRLSVAPQLAMLPLGAPVRVNFKLSNTSSQVYEVPDSLSMKKGHVKGWVVDPFGNYRSFVPIVICIDEEQTRQLKPNDWMSHSLTLLRGAQGALFPHPGTYKIIVSFHWDVNEVVAKVLGETSVVVSGAKDEAHAMAASKVLSSPDSLLTLVFGGDHLTEGIEAIQTALDNATLRPHYEYIEAKRISANFKNKKGTIKKCTELITKDTVMNEAELNHLAEFIGKEKKHNKAEAAIAAILKNRGGA